MDRDPLEFEWLAQHWRFTVFPGTDQDIGNVSLTDVTGLSIDQMEAKPKENFSREVTAFGGGLLALQKSTISGISVRIDLSYEPMLPSEEIPTARSLFIGEVEDTLSAIEDKAGSWLSGTKIPVLRLALAGRICVEANDVPEAYRKLGTYFRSLIVKPEMRDVVYRVNWRTDPDIPESSHINRITTGTVTIVNSFVKISADRQSMRDSRTYMNVDIDINTPAENTIHFSRDISIRLFSELFRLARENIKYGEIAQ